MDNEIRVDNIASNRRIRFNKKFSGLLQKYGLIYVDVINESDDIFIYFHRNKEESSYTMSTMESGCYVLYNSQMTKKVADRIGEESYLFKILKVEKAADTEKGIIRRLELKRSLMYNRIKEIEKKKEKELPLYKTCPKCGRTLPNTEFYAKGDNLQSWCKDCVKDHGRLRNGSTGVYRSPALSQFTDEQLWDELKSRGYKGEISKNKILN